MGGKGGSTEAHLQVVQGRQPAVAGGEMGRRRRPFRDAVGAARTSMKRVGGPAPRRAARRALADWARAVWGAGGLTNHCNRSVSRCAGADWPCEPPRLLPGQGTASSCRRGRTAHWPHST